MSATSMNIRTDVEIKRQAEELLGLSDELATFYKLYEDYQNDQTQSRRFALEKQGQDLFFKC